MINVHVEHELEGTQPQRQWVVGGRVYTDFRQSLRARDERLGDFFTACGVGSQYVPQPIPEDATPENYDPESLWPLSRLIDEAFEKKIPLLSAAQLNAKRFERRDLIPGILASGKPGGIFGGFKTLKTTLALDLLISIASGTPFLGRFPVARSGKVLFLSGAGEGGLDAVQSIARRICAERGLSLDSLDNLVISPKLPRLDCRIDLMILKELFQKQKPLCVVIDPAHLAIGQGNPRNLFAMGQMLEPLAELCASSGCTVLLVHDCKRAMKAGAPATLDDIAWGGFAGYSAQWLLLSRRKPFDLDTGRHELWLSTGSRTGHRGLWALDVDEGPPPAIPEKGPIVPLMEDERPWKPTLRAVTWAEAGMQAEERFVATSEDRRLRRRDLAVEYQGRRILEVLCEYPNGATQRRLRDRLGVSGERMNRLLEALEEEGLVAKDEEQIDRRRKRVTYTSTQSIDFATAPTAQAERSGTGPTKDRQIERNPGESKVACLSLALPIVEPDVPIAEPDSQSSATAETSPSSQMVRDTGRDTSKDRENPENSPQPTADRKAKRTLKAKPGSGTKPAA